jgi:hypothetical protein
MSCWRRDATEDRRWRCSSCGELIRVKPWPPQISHRWCMHVGNLIHARLHQCGPRGESHTIAFSHMALVDPGARTRI